MNAVARYRFLVETLIDEVWNLGRLDVMDSLVAAHAVPSRANAPAGPGSWKADVDFYRTRLADLHYGIEDYFECGDRAVARWSATAIDTHGILGDHLRGSAVRFSGITIYRFELGLLVEHWAEISVGVARALPAYNPQTGEL